ncbi:MAG: hypothetical protein GWP15_03130 [Nitrospirae bacterium]|nr:hypothetical protein [Nitrospirota bacterium]
MKIIKKEIHGKEARARMLEGINQMADVVGSTLGAKGRNVIVDKEYGAPLVVNDGLTIIREIFDTDQVKNNAMQLIKDAAVRTNDNAGDGTTGATMLAREIVKLGWDAIEKGANPVFLRNELVDATEKIITELKEQSKDVTDVEQKKQVASISVQDTEIGGKIGELIHKVGANGAVTLKSSIKKGVFVESDGGMKLEGQMMFATVTQQEKEAHKKTMENVKVLVLKDCPEDHEFETKWIPFIKKLSEGYQAEDGSMVVTKVNVPTLLVIAEKVPQRVLAGVSQNRAWLKFAWFRPSTAGKDMEEIYKDLQSMIGGKVVEEKEGDYLNKTEVDDLGDVEMAVVGRYELIVTVAEENLKANEYLDRCNEVKKQQDAAEDDVEKEQIKDRFANLTGGIASIKIAGSTPQETVDLKLRIEDSVNATKSAVEDGIVSGGGIALLNASKVLEGKTEGEKVLKRACEATSRQILYNAGFEDPKELDKIIRDFNTHDGVGMNVIEGTQVDMVEKGIIDPLKVIKESLVNAVSVGGLLLTSEYSITNATDEMDAVRKFFIPPKE